jgi:hypothetical protein
MGTRVSSTISDMDVESRLTFFYGVGRVDHLHCSGGHILSDGAPFSGNAPTGGAGITCGCVIGDPGLEVLFEGELHVRLHREHQSDGFSSTSLCSSNGCEGVSVSHDSADLWWSAEGYG